jgi:cation diffusion facilitator CzcD-associated flavoprotein CzcO
VTTRNLDGEARVEVFDYVAICIGHHTIPNIPAIPGVEEFTGLKFHTHNFRESKIADLADKTVLIVGSNLSAADLTDQIYIAQDTNPPRKIITTKRTPTSSSLFSLIESKPIFKAYQSAGLIETGRIISHIEGNAVHF